MAKFDKIAVLNKIGSTGHEVHVVRLTSQGQHDIVLADAAEAFSVDIGQEGIIP